MNTPDLTKEDAQLAGWPNAARRLREALANDEFVLYCQPILALDPMQRYPIGEVLVRMRAEEKAHLPPGDFLPVFEHYGMMAELDRWVVRNVAKWLTEDVRIPRLSVNLGGQTLEDPDFPRFVAGQLAMHGVSPKAVVFEIDESDTLRRHEAALRFVTAYRAMGGAIMVDGFGRRSVSFAAVKALAPEFVKIDGSLTRKLLQSETAKRKINALLTVARSLDFGLIGECVEEQETLLRLKALGVGYAQGYGVLQPQPIEIFTADARRHLASPASV